MMCTLEKSTNTRKAKTKIGQWQRRKTGTEILMRLSEPYLELISVLKETSENFIFTFLFRRHPICA
jgi:hypothetical protein